MQTLLQRVAVTKLQSHTFLVIWIAHQKLLVEWKFRVVSISRCYLSSEENHIMKTRPSDGHLIVMVEVHIPEDVILPMEEILDKTFLWLSYFQRRFLVMIQRHLYIESRPWSLSTCIAMMGFTALMLPNMWVDWGLLLHVNMVFHTTYRQVSNIRLNIGSGNGLVPDSTKLLPEPILIYHWWCSVAFTWEQLYSEFPRY